MMGFTFVFDLLVLLLWNQNVHSWGIFIRQFCNVIWLRGSLILDRGVNLYVLYHLGYFYVMCYMCDNIDSCGC